MIGFLGCDTCESGNNAPLEPLFGVKSAHLTTGSGEMLSLCTRSHSIFSFVAQQNFGPIQKFYNLDYVFNSYSAVVRERKRHCILQYIEHGAVNHMPKIAPEGLRVVSC